MAAGPCRAKDPMQRMRRALHEGTQGGLSRGPRVWCCHMLRFWCCCVHGMCGAEVTRALAMHDVPVLFKLVCAALL